VILLFFILSHVWNTRFAGVASQDMFDHMAGMLSNPGTMAFYILGVVSAAFHLGNGLWGFAYAWGLVTGQKSQDRLWVACMGLSVAVAFLGINALLGFRGQAVQLFEMGH
jgi:succinate dehydrogenase / fumarate reductase cytochrome b subunit